MATKDWKKDEGMESPGWYNIKWTNPKSKGKIKEIIASNSSAKHEGTRHANSQWTVSFYDKDGQPTGMQINFSNKTKALKRVRGWIANH